MAAGRPPGDDQGTFVRPPPPHDTLWPAAHLPCNPMSQCSVLDCVKQRSVMLCRRDGETIEVARRFCLAHANEYDVERFQIKEMAPVLDIATGMRIA